MLILVPFLLTKSNILDILLLGENTAISLGIAVEREIRLLLIASVAPYLCLRCRQWRDRFCGTGSAAYGTKADRRQTPRPYAYLHAAGGAAVAFGRHAGTVCLSAEGDPGWYRDLRAFGSVFSVPAPQVFLREDVYAFTYAGKGFVCRI